VSKVQDLYSPTRFRENGHSLVDLLAGHLTDAAGGKLPAVMPAGRPADFTARFAGDFPEIGDGDVLRVVAEAMAASTALHSPGFIGHQVATPLPDAALCDLAASLLNNGMAVFEMGPAASAMERAVLAYLARVLGLPATAGGVLTSGGSVGNLTALLAARQAKAGFDVWREGLRNRPQLVVFVAETAHYCVARSLRILGLGDGGVVAVPVDERMRMQVPALEDELRRARRHGRRPIAVVASACSTAAGAFDPIDAIADVCAREDLWLHVDGAHGASLALSPRHRDTVRGIERADSVVWDAHKMMLMPALITAVLFRDAAAGARAFSQEAGYLFDETADNDAWSDIGRRTIECTKRMMSLKLYAALAAHGTRVFAEHVDAVCALTRYLAAGARARGLSVLVEPECDIVCFRHPDHPGGATAGVRRALLAEGRFYIVQVHLASGLWLRCTVLNPGTTTADVDQLLDRVVALYAEQ
jgi:L-2,4-diaminobutyrate decarboxylase